VEEQIQWMLSYVQRGLADIWKENMLDVMERFDTNIFLSLLSIFLDFIFLFFEFLFLFLFSDDEEARDIAVT